MNESPFAPLIEVHQRLVRRPEVEAAAGTALYPRDPGAPDAPDRWTPSFELVPYQSVDPEALGLEGTDSFHDLESEKLKTAIRKVIEVEGPAHFDLLGDRLLTSAGAGRMGARIRERIEDELTALESGGEILRRGSFVGRPEQFARPRWRDFGALPDKHRKLEYVPDSELMLCIFHAVLANEGIDPDQALNDGIYQIGFPRLTEKARERLQAPLQALFERQILRERSGGLYLGMEVFVRGRASSFRV